MTASDKITLFEDKEKCCGCGGCYNVCPQGAISMKQDEFGFLYPQIDHDKCISCGLCKSVCAFQNTQETNTPVAAYAAVNRDREQLFYAASGGLFTALAEKILSEGGAVFGCAMDIHGGKITVHHVMADKKEDLKRLQGSKYVQSDTEKTFSETMTLLEDGRKVLYSGTPCQIAALKEFLKKDYDNLILVDIICHGVPGVKMLQGYLDLEKEKRGYKEITGYLFRDKKAGWGENSGLYGIDKKGREAVYRRPARLSSYYALFLDGLISRKNCYSCKYACEKRPGDITVGDFWGIAYEHPDILKKGGAFVEDAGISCLIANTEKGRDFCEDGSLNIEKVPSTFEKIAKGNVHLNRPYEYTPKRDRVMELYLSEGYAGVEKLYMKAYKKQRLIHFVFNKLPRSLRNKIKKYRLN
ncbi:MAG: Coenzyme F420 hydrogenase/dehydrogenase, beta subunit C-terminal domain [Butyrivibrio sp.]|nr:Coenzyme F420 hydrogenase/dehydrogenase, beta subunit C-terminal domain [Butyrivibrio sp.]